MDKLESIKTNIANAMPFLKTKVNDVCGVPPMNPYNTDTIAKMGEEIPEITIVEQAKSSESSEPIESQKKSLIDTHYEIISDTIDDELKKQLKDRGINFEKLQQMIYKIVRLHMRRAVKADQEYLSDMNAQIKLQAIKIQQTYNTWTGMTITYISAAVSVIGGIGGLTPLLPASLSSLISPATSELLLKNSNALSTAGSSLQSVGQIPEKKKEGERQVLNITLKRLQDKEEDRKGAKQNNNQTGKEARSAYDEALRVESEAKRAILGS